MLKRSAIVTGASSGIGAAVARALAKAGSNVVVTYGDNRRGAEMTVQACHDAGVEAFLINADVSKDEDCQAIAQAALDTWGGIDIVVNNAGTTRFAHAADLKALSADDFERIFAVNVTGCYQMTRAAATHLQAAKGSVVNISSHSGFSGIGSSMAYAASKGALNTLTLSLARTLAPHVRVNAVCPGFVDTNWMAPHLDADALVAFKEKTAAIAPLKRVPSADDVAEVVLWFALGQAPVTGQLLVVDSGTHLSVGAPL